MKTNTILLCTALIVLAGACGMHTDHVDPGKQDPPGDTTSIPDEKPEGRFRSYEAASGNWRMKKELSYDDQGRILTLATEMATPGSRTNLQKYFYDVTGKIEKITDVDSETSYTWVDGRIVKSETTSFAVLKSYTEFEYDGKGNVSKAKNYYRQPSGSYVLSFINHYSYHDDGNLATVETTLSSLKLLSRKTYDGYIDTTNPFPMVEIHPAVRTQKGLATIHTIQEAGMNLNYYMSYEFTNSGLVKKRISASETVTYTYY